MSLRPRPDAATRKKLRILQLVSVLVLAVPLFVEGDGARKFVAVYGFLALGFLLVIVGRIIVQHMRTRNQPDGDDPPVKKRPSHRR